MAKNVKIIYNPRTQLHYKLVKRGKRWRIAGVVRR